MAGWPPINGLLALQQEPQQNMLRGMLSPATANQNMLAQATAARSNQQRNMLSGPTTGAEFAQNVGMVPGLGLLGVGGDIAQYIDRPETRGWLPYALTAAGAIPFLGALSKMAGPMPHGILSSQMGAIAKQAKVGGETGLNNEFYKGGQFLPGSELTEKGKLNLKFKAGKKAEIEPYNWVPRPADGMTPFYGRVVESLDWQHFKKTGESRVAWEPGSQRIQYLSKQTGVSPDAILKEMQSDVNKWASGARWKDADGNIFDALGNAIK